MADRRGACKGTVARIWTAANARPWRVDTCKLSNDSLFDVVGVYLNPPEPAVVFSFDEARLSAPTGDTRPPSTGSLGIAKRNEQFCPDVPHQHG